MSERFDDHSLPADPARDDVSPSDTPVTNRKSPILLLVTIVLLVAVIIIVFVTLG